jgi:hypothetical protein
MSKASEYRITLSQLIAPAPVEQPKPSLCYPDRHYQSDRQVAMTTLRYLGTALVCAAVAIGFALIVGVR